MATYSQYPVAIIGLLGVVIGSVLATLGNLVLFFLTRSRERKHWERENSRIEYRELISTLSQSAHCFADNSPGLLYEVVAVNHEQRQKAQEAHNDALRTIEDRLVIASRIEEEKILERWELLTSKTDWSGFWNEWKVLHAALVKMAHEDLRIEKR